MTTAYKVIIWDFNGTILNDVTASVATINELLLKRNLPLLSLSRYKAIFDFPVYDYYERLGFDFNSEEWEDAAAEYMTGYHNKEAEFDLFEHTIDTLKALQAQGKKQYILSAMKTESIIALLKTYNISQYFDGIHGLDNHYANGKVELGEKMIELENLNPDECLMIGDTTHDAAVAQSLGFDCLLFSQGHHNKQRLLQTGFDVIDELNQLTQNKNITTITESL